MIDSNRLLLKFLQTIPQVLISNEYFFTNGADWTIIPLIEPILILNERHKFHWVTVLEEYTNVNSVDILLNELAKYNDSSVRYK